MLIQQLIKHIKHGAGTIVGSLSGYEDAMEYF